MKVAPVKVDAGIFAFDGSASGNGLADFLLGEVTTATRRPLIDLGMLSWNSSYFIQDDVRVSKRLIRLRDADP